MLYLHISSVGKRICLGEPLARNTIFLFTAALAKTFEFKSLPNKPPPTLEPTIGLGSGPKPFQAVVLPRVHYNQFPTIIMLCLHVHNSPQHQREKSLVLSFNRTSEHVLHLFHILLYYVTQIRLYGNRVKKVTLKVLNRCFAFYNVLHFYYVLQISCTFLYQQSALSESFIC